MAITSLRRAHTVDGGLEFTLSETSANRLSIQSVDSSPVEPLCDNYPFEQYSYKGTLTYQEQSQYTKGRDISVGFEYRDGSNLFLVELETDFSPIADITDALEEAIPNKITVYRNLHAPEDALWDFLKESDRIIDIRVLDDGQEISYREVEGYTVEEVIGHFAIERAQVGFNYQNNQIVVDYRQGEIQIESDWEQGREYIIQLFEREVLAD